MARIYVDVDVDIAEHLDECSTEELKEELNERGFDIVVGIIEENNKPSTLYDKMKAEMFESKYKNIPLNELELFLKTY